MLYRCLCRVDLEATSELITNVERATTSVVTEKATLSATEGEIIMKRKSWTICLELLLFVRIFMSEQKSEFEKGFQMSSRQATCISFRNQWTFFSSLSICFSTKTVIQTNSVTKNCSARRFKLKSDSQSFQCRT